MSYEDAVKRLEKGATGEKRLCCKDMAKNLGPCINTEFLCSFQNTIMVRHPRFSLSSLRKAWPEFTDEHSGFGPLHSTMTLLRDAGERFVVLDGMDLIREPQKTVKAWCNAMDIKYIPEALNWEGNHYPWKQPSGFEGFFSDVRNSKTLGARVVKEPVIDEWLAKRIDSAMPYYRELEMLKMSA